MSENSRSLMPVVGVEVYDNDMVVVRSPTPNEVKGVAKRGTISEFSAKSRRRLAFVASNTSVEFRSMITLTYPSEFPGNGWTVKDNLHTFLNNALVKLGSFEYLWFLEFQKRGAPHIHILTDIKLFHVKQSEHYRKLVSESWFLTVASNDIRHLKAGTRFENLRSEQGGKRYAVKYAQKMRQKSVPARFENVGRFFGYSEKVKPTCRGFIPINGYDLMKILNDWPYVPKTEYDLYRILFNTSGTYSPDVVLAQTIQKEVVLIDDEHYDNLELEVLPGII